MPVELCIISSSVVYPTDTGRPPGIRLPCRVSVSVSAYRQHLALADRHIAQARRLIAQQVETLAALKRDGKATEEAETLLASWLDSLAVFEAYQRTLIDGLMGEANGQGARPPTGRVGKEYHADLSASARESLRA